MKSIFLGALMALTTLSVNAQDDFMRSSEVKVTKSEPYEVVDIIPPLFRTGFYQK